MPDERDLPEDAEGRPEDEGEVMAGDRRIARSDTALPDWYVSDTHYRPIPIVWFAGALLMQVIAQPVLVGLTFGVLGLPQLVVVAICLAASGLIWHFTYERGMAEASAGWRWGTGLMLAFFFGITALSLLN